MSSLTPDDVAAVLRRAAELDTRPLDEHDLLDESVVREAAREVGLSDAAVSQAVQEWRAGALAPLPPLPADRRVGLASTVAVERRLPGDPAAVRAALGGWLRMQWFECRRVSGDESRWVPRSGPLAASRRALDLRRSLRLDHVQGLRLCVAAADSGSRVRLVADLGGSRAGLLTGLVAGPAVVTGVGAAVLFAAAGHPVPEALTALPSAAAAGGVGWLGARRVLHRRCLRVQDELDLALDALVAPPVERGVLPTWAVGLLPHPRSRARARF